MNLRFLASALGAAVVAATTAGCGASADLSSVAKAANKTEDAKTLNFTMAVDLKGEPDVAGDGVLDFPANSGVLEMREKSGLTTKVIWNGSTLYVKGWPLDMSGGKPWMKVDDSNDFTAYTTSALFNPGRQFALLQKVGEFEASGAADVHGTPTTRYEGNVDAKQFIQEFAPKSSEDDESSTVATGTFPVKVWIDGDGLVRRVFYDIPDMGPDDPAAKLTLEFYDFGESVDTSPPPADQVGEAKLPSYTATQRSERHTLTLESTIGG